MRPPVLALLLASLMVGCGAVPAAPDPRSPAGMAGMQPGGHATGPGAMVFADSRYPFPETVERLKAAIRARGMEVVFVEDQQATLRKLGVKSPGAVVIEFFSADYTRRIFEIDHAAHMEIPLRIGAMEGSEHDPHSKATHVMYYRPSSVFAAYKGMESVAADLDRILEAIVATVMAPKAAGIGR